MSTQDVAFHYVCTWDQAEQIVKNSNRWWVSNCGCREQKGGCARSRIDVCLLFRPDIPGSGGSGIREISRVELDGIFREAREKLLVTRPFRNDKNRAVTEGICFCCDDCCGYFLNREEKCDKGILVEKTDTDLCTNCADCVDICYFLARRMADGELQVDRDACYGCGLCSEICPEHCVEMVGRS